MRVKALERILLNNLFSNVLTVEYKASQRRCLFRWNSLSCTKRSAPKGFIVIGVKRDFKQSFRQLNMKTCARPV